MENLFYLSFIIREGQCGLQITDEGEPEICGCTLMWSDLSLTRVTVAKQQPTDQDYAQGIKKNQMVIELTMDDWKRSIELFDIREPMIPHRAKVAAPNGKWYG